MKKGNTILAFLKLVVLLLLLAGLGLGCESPPEVVEEVPEEVPEEEIPEEVDLPTITARIGGIHPVEGPYTKALINFANRVADKTDGKLTFEVYPASQLGGARELIESSQTGALEGVYAASAFYVPFEITMAIPGLPYLFPTKDVIYDILIEGDSGRAILDSLERVNLKGVGFFEGGVSQLTGNFPINEPGDLRGKKIRVMEDPILIAKYRAFGSTPEPIPYGEVYTALQMGVVDGQENPLGGIYDMKFYEVQDYLALTNHSFLAICLAFNLDWFNNLPQEYQEAIYTAAQEEAFELRKVIEEMEEDVMLPAIVGAGVEIIEFLPEEREAFAEIAKPAAEEALLELLDAEGEEILIKVKEEVAELMQ